jgi:hypothetical protein
MALPPRPDEPGTADTEPSGELPTPLPTPVPSVPPPSLTEQQMIAFRAAFDSVLLQTGSIPPPARPSMAVKAGQKTVEGANWVVKSAGIFVLLLPVLAKIWPEYITIIQAVLSALHTASQ